MKQRTTVYIEQNLIKKLKMYCLENNTSMTKEFNKFLGNLLFEGQTIGEETEENLNDFQIQE